MTQNKQQPSDRPAQIAKSIRDAILNGVLMADDRLPSEAELSEQFQVSRPTVREALKRLAAQSLIRTQRGAFGGAFIHRLSYAEAQDQHVTTSTLLLSINDVGFDVACEARYALERSCTRLAAERRTADHLATMRAEIHRQGQPGLSDESFCASDVTLHRALVDSTGNPILSYQLAGSVEAMQPLMNMITFTARSRAHIVELHTRLADALEAREAVRADAVLSELEDYTLSLGQGVMAARAARRPDTKGSK
ncbi:MAG: FadR family transcriptional regulator [Pelagimonas sp.]